MNPLADYLALRKGQIDAFLASGLESSASRLAEAMRYSSLSEGKRLRGILCLASAEAVSCSAANSEETYLLALPVAAGLECLHSMSLIHDDLPCMDDDDLRRGQPSCHRRFDEATALLAGDALLVEGIGLCLQAALAPERKIAVVQLILEAIGARGMTAGQMLDLEAANTATQPDLAQLERIHRHKTGALLRASVLAGALALGATEEQQQALECYAIALGLAFQIVDDLLDLEGSTATLGKTSGKDLRQNKATYPRLLGVEGSRAKARLLITEAQEALREANIDFPPLLQLADYVVQREH